ncbi:MAG: PAS domain-containing protein [Stellaceae bacterium]
MSVPPFDPASSPSAITANWDMTAAVDQRLHQIHNYWKSRCRNREMPSRRDIDPIDVPRLLPFIFLVDVLNDPRDFRFRLTGTHFRDFVGTEITGLMISEVFPPAFAAEVHHHWSNCVDRRAPAVGSGKLWVAERSHVEWEGIVLPLSPDGENVNMLIGGAIFAPRQR